MFLTLPKKTPLVPRLLLGGITIALLAALGYVGTMSTASAGAISIDAVPKLLANDAALNDNFGWVVAIDGNTAVVGIEGDGSSGTTPGAAYVFVRTGSAWNQQQKLVALDGANGDQFGISVAISGESIVIGANLDDDGGSLSGSAYVFVRNGTDWTEQGKLVASDAAAVDQFGKSVGISGDTAIVSAVGNGIAGSTYVFVHNAGIWTQQAQLIASDEEVAIATAGRWELAETR